MAFKPFKMNSKSFKSALGIFVLMLVSVNMLSSFDFHAPSSTSLHSAVNVPSGTIKKETGKQPSIVQRKAVRIVAGPPTTCSCSQDMSVTPGTCYDFINGGPACTSRTCGFPYVCDNSGSTTCDLRTVTSKIVLDADGSGCTLTMLATPVNIYVPQ